MDNKIVTPVLAGLAAVGILAAGLLWSNNSTLHAELETLKAGRTALQNEAKAANERANVADRTSEEVKAEIAKVQAANETVNHAVTQLRNQLEQVQIQANTAREDYERRLTANAEDVSKAKADAQRAIDENAKAQAEVKRLAQEADSARADKDAVARELKTAQDDLIRERRTREAAEAKARGASANAPTPPTANDGASSAGNGAAPPRARP